MKKSTSIVVLVALAISVCLNIVQLCVSSYHTYAYNQTENVQAGTYLEDPEQIVTSKIMTLDGTDHLFYYYKNDDTILKQGRYEVKEDGTGVLYGEDNNLCGYAVSINRESTQVIWTDGSYTIFTKQMDVPVIPSGGDLS